MTLDPNQVYCANAEAIFQNLDDASMPLIVADPSYGIGYPPRGFVGNT